MLTSLKSAVLAASWLSTAGLMAAAPYGLTTVCKAGDLPSGAAVSITAAVVDLGGWLALSDQCAGPREIRLLLAHDVTRPPSAGKQALYSAASQLGSYPFQRAAEFSATITGKIHRPRGGDADAGLGYATGLRMAVIDWEAASIKVDPERSSSPCEVSSSEAVRTGKTPFRGRLIAAGDGWFIAGVGCTLADGKAPALRVFERVPSPRDRYFAAGPPKANGVVLIRTTVRVSGSLSRQYTGECPSSLRCIGAIREAWVDRPVFEVVEWERADVSER